MTDMNNLTIDNETGEILNKESDTDMNSTSKIPSPTELQDQSKSAVNSVPPKTRKQFIDEMVYIYGELDAVNETLKELKSQAKELGYNPALIMLVAKALAQGKETELQEKTSDTLEILDEVLGD